MRGFIITVIVLGAAFFFMFSHFAEKNRLEKTEAYEFGEEIKKASASEAQVREAFKSIPKFREELLACLHTVSNEVVSVFDENDALRIMNPDALKAKLSKPAARVQPSPVAVKQSVPRDKPVHTAPAPQKEELLIDEEGREVPEGIMSPAELAALKKREAEERKRRNRGELLYQPAATAQQSYTDEDGREAPADFNIKKTTTPSQSAADIRPENLTQATDPDETRFLNEMRTIYLAVTKQYAAIEDTQAKADELEYKATDILVAARKSGVSDAARSKNEELKAVVSKAKMTMDALPAVLDEARKSTEQAQRTRRSLESHRSAKADAEEKMRLAAEREKRRKAELERAGSIMNGKYQIVRKYSYDTVLAELQSASNSMEFQEAKNIVAPHIRRLTLLSELKTFLIESINNKAFTWGWKATTASYDITAADESGITVQGKQIEWDAVEPWRMIHMFKHYVDALKQHETTTAYYYLTMAVFRKIHSIDDVPEGFAERARTISPAVAQEADAVMHFTPESDAAPQAP